MITDISWLGTQLGSITDVHFPVSPCLPYWSHKIYLQSTSGTIFYLLINVFYSVPLQRADISCDFLTNLFYGVPLKTAGIGCDFLTNVFYGVPLQTSGIGCDFLTNIVGGVPLQTADIGCDFLTNIVASDSWHRL